MNNQEIHKAEIALRDAKIAKAMVENAGFREKFGPCPSYDGHFDGASFWVGVIIGVMCAFLFAIIVAHFGGFK